MKKIAYLLIALTTMVFTFTSCSDVPMPYEQPSIYDDGSTSKPEGDGSAANPFNIAAAVAKCKEVGNTLSEEKYYIKGYVTKATTADATYGNATFTMSDDTEGNGGSFTAYQIAGNNGDKLTAGYAFNVGDIVTIYGKIYNYSGSTPETEGKGAAWLIAHEKSGSGGGGGLDVIKKVTVAEFNAAEVENDTWYEMTGTVKNLKDGDQYGNFDLEDATGSVYVYGLLAEKGGEKKKFQELVAKYGIANGSTITIRANRGDYQGKIEAMNAYIVPEGGGGSSESTTVADFLAAPVSTDTWYQLTGTIKNLKDGDQYGNFDLEDATGSVYVYGVLSEKGGAKKLFQELVAKYGIVNGSKITIIGNRGEYQGNPQVTNAYFVSVEGGGGGDTPSGGAKGNGSLQSPYNPLGAINAVKDLTWTSNTDYQTTDDVYVKGKISRIANNGTYAASGTYGNASFYISEDGTENNEFYCYHVLYLGNQKYTSGTDIKVGDEVIICGKLMNYRGNTPETVNNGAYLYSLNGTTDGGGESGGGEQGGGDQGGANTTKNIDGTIVTLTDPTATVGESVTVDFDAQGWTNEQAAATITLNDGTVITFQKGSASNPPKYYTATHGVRFYATNGFTITGSSKAVAKVVIECDEYSGTKYVGNETLYGNVNGKVFTIVNDYTQASGGVQLRAKKVTIYYVQ